MSILWWLLITLLPEANGSPCIATTFGSPGDKHAGGAMLWTGELATPFDIGIAVRDMPTGEVVIVEYKGRYTFAIVMDHGPYGACLGRGKVCRETWYVKKYKSQPPPPPVCEVLESMGRKCKALRWRGCGDLNPRTSKRIGHRGWGRVSIHSTGLSLRRRAPDWYHEASKQWRRKRR